MIRTDSDEYFIEPLERGTQELEDQGRVHVVYRRSAVLKDPSDISVDYQQQGRTRHLKNYCSPEDVTTADAAAVVIFLPPVVPMGLSFCSLDEVEELYSGFYNQTITRLFIITASLNSELCLTANCYRQAEN